MNQRRDEPPESVILDKFKGIKNSVTAERLGPDALESAVNVDLDDSGQVRRRRGFTERMDGAWHSLHATPGGLVLGVRNNQLVKVLPNFTVQVLGDGGSDPISYVEIANTVYFSSRAVSGKINPDLTISPWGIRGGAGEWLSPVIRPTETLGPVEGKLLRAPPLAEWLAEMNGRIYLAEGSMLWATELYLPDLIDATRTFFQYEAAITGLQTCGEGMYVGTEQAVYYISGPLGQMSRKTVVESGCVAGSMIPAIGDLALVAGEPALQHRDAVMFMTPQGLIVGFNNGFCRNLTANETLFPPARRVAPMLRQQDGMHHYVAVADSGGGPTANARIGDYVDAEIRRAVDRA